MMVSSLAKSVFYVGMLSSGAVAWSSVGSSDRRGFLQNASRATGFIGIAGICGGEVFVDSAQAAMASTPAAGASNKATKENSSVYQPLPGSLLGQVHVITGSSTGLGLEASKRLAAAGATVVLTTRTTAKAECAKNQVQEYLQERSITNPEIYVVTLDLDDLASVKSFPDRYSQLLGSRKIDVLMNNAGTITKSREFTKDGFEKTFQSNHLGPFLLTSLLFPYLNRTGNGSRIINVSSVYHEFARTVKTGKAGLDMDNLNGELSYRTDGWEAYGQTKLENILFTVELQRRADAAGLTWLTVVALHPGVVGTDIWRSTYVSKSNDAMTIKGMASKLFYNNVLSTEEGANTQVMLAANGELRKG
jgi:NAD(P)-dependent dehydrogenase (short-subunit alcohol dehydrogenase family)